MGPRRGAREAAAFGGFDASMGLLKPAYICAEEESDGIIVVSIGRREERRGEERGGEGREGNGRGGEEREGAERGGKGGLHAHLLQDSC